MNFIELEVQDQLGTYSLGFKYINLDHILSIKATKKHIVFSNVEENFYVRYTEENQKVLLKAGLTNLTKDHART